MSLGEQLLRNSANIRQYELYQQTEALERGREKIEALMEIQQDAYRARLKRIEGEHMETSQKAPAPPKPSVHFGDSDNRVYFTPSTNTGPPAGAQAAGQKNGYPKWLLPAIIALGTGGGAAGGLATGLLLGNRPTVQVERAEGTDTDTQYELGGAFEERRN